MSNGSNWSHVPRQYAELWKDRRYRYGAVIPLLALLIGLSALVAFAGQPLVGLGIVASPLLIVAIFTLADWWGNWLDRGTNASASEPPDIDQIGKQLANRIRLHGR